MSVSLDSLPLPRPVANPRSKSNVDSSPDESVESSLRRRCDRAEVESFASIGDDGFLLFLINLVELDSAISSSPCRSRPSLRSSTRSLSSPIAMSCRRRGGAFSQRPQRPSECPGARPILADRRLQVWGLVRRRRREDARGRGHRLLFPGASARDRSLCDGQGKRGDWRAERRSNWERRKRKERKREKNPIESIDSQKREISSSCLSLILFSLNPDPWSLPPRPPNNNTRQQTSSSPRDKKPSSKTRPLCHRWHPYEPSRNSTARQHRSSASTPRPSTPSKLFWQSSRSFSWVSRLRRSSRRGQGTRSFLSGRGCRRGCLRHS